MKRLCFIVLILGLAAFLYAEDAVTIPPAPTAMPTAAATIAPAADNTPNAGNQGYRLTLDVDFTSVAMKRANDSIVGYPPYSQFGGAFQAMLDYGVAALPNLFLGGRVGYLFCLPASYEYDDGLIPNTHNKVSRDAELIPLELGARLRFAIPFTSAGISVGAYGGMCFAMVNNNINGTRLGAVATCVQQYSGLGFSGEFSMALELKLAKGIDFNVNGGYRIAGVPSVTQSADASLVFPGPTAELISAKGSILRDASSAIVPFDFSGMHIGLGVSLGY